MLCLIAYDIASAKRLQRCFRVLSGYAHPLQNSVFFFNDERDIFQQCWKEIEEIIDAKEDDVRAYELPAQARYYSLGEGSLPDGVLWSGAREKNWSEKEELEIVNKV